jgi:hypothetical protein
LYFVTPEQIREVTNLSVKYDEQRVKTQNTADAQAVYGVKVELAGNKASNAVQSINSNSNALDNNAASALGAAAAQSEFMQKLQQSATQTATINKLIDKGHSPERAKALAEAYFQGGNKISANDVKLIDYNITQNAKMQASIDAVSKAKAAGAKASKSAQAQAKKEASELENLIEQQKRDREQIAQTYSSDYENIMSAEAQELERIANAGFKTVDQAKYTELAKMRFEAERAEYFKSLNLELFQFKWTEEKKLEYAYQQDKEIVENDTKTNGIVKEGRLKFLDDQYAIELRKAKWHALEMQQTMQDAIKGLSGDADNIFAKATMSPTEFAGWSLQNERDNAKASLKNQRVGVEQDIMSASPDVYATDEDRYAALQQAHKEYRDALAAIDVQYYDRVKQLALDQKLQQLSTWQEILSNGQNTFSQLTQAVQSSAGEQSSAYQIMFAGQQAFSVASSMMAAWTAYTQAFADPSKMTIEQKFAGGIAVMAALAPALATISSMAIEGFATGGHITGAGTGTSDDIPIWASNGEFMIRTAAVEKLGLANLNYMNATGEIPNKYATGGAITLDPPKVLNTQSEKMNGYREQARATQSQTIDNQIRVAIFDDRADMMNQMYGKDGEKVVMYHLKRNGMLKA